MSADEMTRQAVTHYDFAQLFKSLSDPTRLRILNLLSGGEVCVCFLANVLDEVQPKISRHLAYLKRTGMVKARREGKWMHYQWGQQPHPIARSIMDSLRDWMAKDHAMQDERGKLKRARCR